MEGDDFVRDSELGLLPDLVLTTDNVSRLKYTKQQQQHQRYQQRENNNNILAAKQGSNHTTTIANNTTTYNNITTITTTNPVLDMSSFKRHNYPHSIGGQDELEILQYTQGKNKDVNNSGNVHQYRQNPQNNNANNDTILPQNNPPPSQAIQPLPNSNIITPTSKRLLSKPISNLHGKDNDEYNYYNSNPNSNTSNQIVYYSNSVLNTNIDDTNANPTPTSRNIVDNKNKSQFEYYDNNYNNSNTNRDEKRRKKNGDDIENERKDYNPQQPQSTQKSIHHLSIPSITKKKNHQIAMDGNAFSDSDTDKSDDSHALPSPPQHSTTQTTLKYDYDSPNLRVTIISDDETAYSPMSRNKNHISMGRRSAPIFSKRSFMGSTGFWRTSTENVTVQEDATRTTTFSSKSKKTKNTIKVKDALFKKKDKKNTSGSRSRDLNKIDNDNNQSNSISNNAKRGYWSECDVKNTEYHYKSSKNVRISKNTTGKNTTDSNSPSQGKPRQHQNSTSSSGSTPNPMLRYFTPDLNTGRTVSLFTDTDNDQNNSDNYNNYNYNTLNPNAYDRKHSNISADVLDHLDQLYAVANNNNNNNNSSSNNNNKKKHNHNHKKDEKTPLLNSRSPSSSSIIISSTPKHKAPSKMAVYKKRWYMLFVFSLYSFIWNAVWTTWGPIAQSAKAVFDWSDGNIAMFTWLGNVPIIIVMFPFAYLMDVKGMRLPMLLCVGLTMVGTALRCISADPEAATWLNYGGQMLNGVAGAVPMSAGAVISGLWFPASQRATATGIATVMGYLGACLSFIVGPLLVPEPTDNDHPINITVDTLQFHQLLANGSSVNTTDVSGLRTNIMNILYYECGGAVLIFLLIFLYFPSKPALPPSKSASLPREDYVKGIKMLVRNKQFWLTSIAYGLPIGVYEVWQVILDVILNPRGVTQETAGWLDFYGTLGGCMAGLLVSRFADLFTRQIKFFLIVFYTLASGSILWFILIVNDVLPFDTVSLYTSIIIASVCLDGSAPLFFELVIEVSYPCGEGVTSGLLQMIVAGSGAIFLSLVQVETLGRAWMNWCFLGCSVFSIPLLCLIKTEFTRASMDDESDEEESDDDEEEEDDDEEKEALSNEEVEEAAAILSKRLGVTGDTHI